MDSVWREAVAKASNFAHLQFFALFLDFAFDRLESGHTVFESEKNAIKKFKSFESNFQLILESN